jgi:hypothetical protein
LDLRPTFVDKDAPVQALRQCTPLRIGLVALAVEAPFILLVPMAVAYLLPAPLRAHPAPQDDRRATPGLELGFEHARRGSDLLRGPAPGVGWLTVALAPRDPGVKSHAWLK